MTGPRHPSSRGARQWLCVALLASACSTSPVIMPVAATPVPAPTLAPRSTPTPPPMVTETPTAIETATETATPTPPPPPPPPPAPAPPAPTTSHPEASAGDALDPRVFATTIGIELWLVSDQVELIGFHQSNHDGAQQLAPHGNLGVTMEDRERDTPSRGAADVALPADVPIHSPVTGTVVRAGTYTLYCEYSDDFVVVEPDGMPGIEVKILHISGVRVHAGDRVEQGTTLLAPSATMLPFESQVNDHTARRDTPHVHIEVVDTSIPDRPSEGGGC